MKETTKFLAAALLFYFTFVSSMFAQKSEIAFLYGFNITSVKFEHPTKVITENEGFTFQLTSQLGIALSAPIIKSSLYLRSHFGFTSSYGLYNLEYDIDIGQGPLGRKVWTWYSNKRLFLSLTPEYRFNIALTENPKLPSQIHLKVNGGLLLHSDIVNSSDAVSGFGYDDLTPSVNGKLAEGFTFGVGMAISIKNIGISLNYSYLRFGKSELFSRFDPSIIYRQSAVTTGLHYRL